jgi:putative nucleotidyltransferase with HDIG domain
VIPADAGTASEALRTADQRMYRDKRSKRGAAGEQAADALLTVLFERHPDVADHSEGVADLAEAVARRLGVAEETALEVREGAALHDIGKAAIPDAILSKPGPLDEGEWAFMRRHTLIGERIVGSAPALAGAARLVRSSHYSASLGFEAALSELRRCAGTQLDPAAVEAFVAIARQRAISPLAV